jgi:branched-chain amino acid transport system substrate-binding protein
VPPSFQCPDSLGCVDIAPKEPIKIGVLQVLSGEVEYLGRDQARMAELALLNRGGKLLGHPVELRHFDEKCSKEGGLTAAHQIVSDPKLVAVFGSTCSGAAATAMEIISQAGYAMISGANTAPSLTSENGQKGPDHHPGFFRTSHNDEIQGRAAAAFTYRVLKLTRAATVHDGDTYTKGLARVFQKEFKRLGGRVVLATSINKGDRDMHPVLSAISGSDAELIFFPLFQPEGNLLLKQARKMPAFTSITMMSADGLLHRSFLESVTGDGKGMYFAGPARPEGSEYEKIIAQYASTYSESPAGPLHAHGYDAVNVLLDAIELSAVQDSDGTLHIGRQALRESLQATSEYKGLTGDIHCKDFGDCGVSKIKIVRLDDPAAGFEGLRANVQYTYMPTMSRQDN